MCLMCPTETLLDDSEFNLHQTGRFIFSFISGASIKFVLNGKIWFIILVAKQPLSISKW